MVGQISGGIMRTVVVCLVLGISVSVLAQSGSSSQANSEQRSFPARQQTLRSSGTAALSAEYARESAGSMHVCPDANDTRSINECMGNEFRITQKNYVVYVRSIGGLLRLGDPDFPNLPASAQNLDRAERSWTAYRDAQCHAYQNLDAGTIQIVNYYDCEIDLTRSHLHELESLYKKDLWE
jgi:hypothetical protein